jgi:hypothetical protein
VPSPSAALPRPAQHDAAAESHGGRQLAGGQGRREVPRSERSHGADWAALDPRPTAGLGRQDPPVGADRLAGEPLEVLSSLAHLGSRLAEGLALFLSENASYWYSLVEWNGFEADQRFVGISNYQAVLADPGFWNSVWISFVFLLLVALARILLSLLLAIVLNSPKLPIANLFRTVFFLPVVTTTAIVGVVMQFVFDPSSGPVNAVHPFARPTKLLRIHQYACFSAPPCAYAYFKACRCKGRVLSQKSGAYLGMVRPDDDVLGRGGPTETRLFPRCRGTTGRSPEDC